MATGNNTFRTPIMASNVTRRNKEKKSLRPLLGTSSLAGRQAAPTIKRPGFVPAPSDLVGGGGRTREGIGTSLLAGGPRPTFAEGFASQLPGTRSVTSETSPFTDLAVPTLDQATSDANFIASIQGTPIGQLSTDDITRLITLQQAQQEQQLGSDLAAQFAPLQAALGGQVTGLEGQLAALTEAEKERVAAEQARAAELLAQSFAPQFSTLERGGEREREAIQRQFSFAGTGRGTRALEKKQESMEIQQEREAALAAEQSLQQRLLFAQIQGESDEVISGIQSQLDAAKSKSQDLDLRFAAAQSELAAQLAEAGQGSVSALLETLQTQAALSQFDPTLSSATGQIVDSQGNPVLGPGGQPLQFATAEFAGLDDTLSAQTGFLTDKNNQAILDDSGQPIPYKPGLIGFTSVGDQVLGIFSDGSSEILSGGLAASIGGTGGGGGVGGGTTETIPSFAELIAQGVLQQGGENLTSGQLDKVQALLDAFPSTTRTISGGATETNNDLF